MKIENWNGHQIRFNDEHKIITQDFMEILEELTNGMYLPTKILNEFPNKYLFGYYELSDGRILKPTLWLEDELLDEENPIVFADIAKAYGENPERYRFPNFQNLKADTEQFVYVIRAKTTNFYKIGCSKDPYQRLIELQVSNPFDLEITMIFKVDDMYSVESKLHKFFKTNRKRGEWFEFEDTVDLMKAKERFELNDLSVSKKIYQMYN